MEKNEKEQEQTNLFGDQDLVYNAINIHILDIDDEISRLLKSKGRIDEKVKKLRKQKSTDLTALNIVGKEIKKSRPDEEEEEVKEAELVDNEEGLKTEEEEVKDAEIVDEEEDIKLEEDETEEETEEKEKEESEDPL